MKKTSISLIFIIALMAFCIWVPDSSAKENYYTDYSCSVCHTPAPVTCAGCHRHGTKNFTATTNKLTYAPGESITVSISGGTKDEPGWVRLILYDQDGNEVARSTGSSGRGGGPAFPGPIKLIATAPTDPGIYTLSASWYGYSTSTNASNFEPDTNNVLAANHGWVNIATNEFEVVSQCDTNAPTVTAPADMTITLAAGNNGPVSISDSGIQNFLDSAEATDAEDGNLPVSNNAPAQFTVGTTPVTFFATDSCENQGSATANVTVEVADNNLPVVTAPVPIEVTAPLCAASVPATNTDIAAFLNGATATDVEDGDVTDSITNDAPADFPVGTVTTVTFTAIDSLGANGTATATVTVNETPNTEPVVTAPAAITIMVPAGTISVPATDPEIVDFLNAVTAMDGEDNNPLDVSNNAPANFPVGTTSVTFSVADSCGVSASAASTITIQEENGNIAPVLNVPDQITVDAQLCANSVPATDPAIVTFLNGATATDDEDGNVTASITNDAPADFPIGTTPVTFSVTDSNGATTTGVATVIVVDKNTAPVVIGPAPLSVTVAAGTTSVPATDTAVAAFLNGATAADIEDGDFPSSSITNNAPADFPMGVTTVTFSVKDGCGLTATAISTVIITEDLPPEEETDDEIDDDEEETDDEIDDDEKETDDEIDDDEKETDDEIDDDEKENKHHKKKKEKGNKYHNEEKQSSTKLRLLRGEED